MKNSHGHGPSQRQLRVGEQLRHAIAETLQRGHFHESALLDESRNITVSEVRMSPDLKKATAYVMTLSGKHITEILPALNDSAFYFQKEISRTLTLKFTPRIHFVADNSFEEVDKIEKILKKIPRKKEEG